MNVNLILFIILTILLVLSIGFEYYHQIPGGVYEQVAKTTPNATREEILSATEKGFWELENPVIWRRTIIAVWLFFVLSYLTIWSLQVSFGNSSTTNVNNYPWVILVLIAFIVFYLVQNYFIYHHLDVVTREMKKNISKL
jgi:hypothetical protein